MENTANKRRAIRRRAIAVSPAPSQVAQGDRVRPRAIFSRDPRLVICPPPRPRELLQTLLTGLSPGDISNPGEGYGGSPVQSRMAKKEADDAKRNLEAIRAGFEVQAAEGDGAPTHAQEPLRWNGGTSHSIHRPNPTYVHSLTGSSIPTSSTIPQGF